MKPLALVLPLVLAALGGGCANTGISRGAFSLGTPASDAVVLAAVADRVRAAAPAVLPPVAAIVADDPAQGLSIVDLGTGAVVGRVQAPIASRPVVAGDLVVARVAGAVVAWSLQGAERWRVPDEGLDLVGASRDGDRVALVLGGAGVTRRRGVVRVVTAGDGSTLARTEIAHALGLPTLVGDDVFVPWDGQNLSVLDARNGDELSRVRSRDDVVGFSVREGHAVYYGARALYRLGAESASGTAAGTPHYQPRPDELPGAATFALDGYTSLRAGLDARERVRLAWRPDPALPGVALLHNTVFALYHRDVFALDATTGALRWAYVSPHDLAGVAVVRAGLVVVDDHGGASLLAPDDGRARWRQALPVGGPQAVLQLAADFAPAPNTDDPPRTLVESLLEAAGGSDARLLPAQRFAAQRLAALPGAPATAALVSILTRRGLSPELRAVVGEGLVGRTDGTDAMIEALDLHYDYVRGVDVPPVGFLARALAAAHERRAVSSLVSHLFDPATPTDDLAPIVVALRELGDPSSVHALADFVRLYHADVGAVAPVGGGDAIIERDITDQGHLNAAVEQAIETIARVGAAPERALLDRVRAHPIAPETVRVAASRVRDGAPPEAPAEAPPGDGAAPAAAGTDMTFGAPAGRLGPDAIDGAMSSRRPEVLACLRDAPSRPAQLRVQFRYDGDGRVSNVSVMPAAFQACVAPIVAAVQLPTSLAVRELGTWICPTAY
jgi:outer membrane protein assembly factor BamB